MTKVWAIIYTNYYACEWQDVPDKELLGIALSKELAEKWTTNIVKTMHYNAEWIAYRSFELIEEKN